MIKTKKSDMIGYLFLLPMLLGLLILRVYGFVTNILYSFNVGSDDYFEGFQFGFDHYINLFQDEVFWSSLGNTLKFMAITIPILLIIEIGIAYFLNKKIKFRTPFRIAYFLPAVILPVAVIQIFMWLFNTQYGLVNSILVQLGLEPVAWFSSNVPITIMVSLVIIYLNFTVPVFILLGGLQDIPKSYYEAASVDGINEGRQFFKITLPLLTPSIFYVLVTHFISGFQVFDVPYIMFPAQGGGIGTNYARTIVYYYYQVAFEYSGMKNYASAISVVLLLLIALTTFILFRTRNKWVYSERNN